MQKTIKYIVGIVLALIVVYFSLDIRKLDEYEASAKPEVFDAKTYADKVWDKEIPKAIRAANNLSGLINQLETQPEKAFAEHGRKLGISATGYFLVNGKGTIISSDEDVVVVRLDDGKFIDLATSFIFGNAVREGSGVVNIDDFINMTDFNNVSVALNKKVKEDVIPALKAGVKVGAGIEFAGAVELNEKDFKTDHMRVVPVEVKFKNANRK